MILSENGSDFRKLNNAKIISGTLIIVTLLMGFFLLTAVHINSASRCVCGYTPGMLQESQNTPYFEPLKALSSEGTSKEMRNFPLRIHMNDPRNLINGENGRVSCEVTRKTASQLISSEPKEVQTPFGNMTTDPKLLHLTGEKLFFSCFNGEPKPKPVVVIARPRIFAIFHRRTPEDSNSTETDDSASGENVSGENKEDQTNTATVQPTNTNKEENSGPLVRNRREAKETMECSCTCPIKKD